MNGATSRTATDGAPAHGGTAGTSSAPRRFDPFGALPSGTVVLEASAGTGKTHTIATLTTRYVAEGVAALPQIMLVTFGRAATSEIAMLPSRRRNHSMCVTPVSMPSTSSARNAAARMSS